MARKHFNLFGRPLGFFHCSVVDSDTVETFARHGYDFGTGTQNILLPPSNVIWADNNGSDGNASYLMEEDENNPTGWGDVDFEEEDFQGDMRSGNPMISWYKQVDAVIATRQQFSG
jgi:hypothetical protein